MKYSILIAVLVYEVLVIGGVGLFLARREARREQREGDFALGGRNLPVSVVAVTLALTVLGTSVVFALGHVYQGSYGVLTVFLVGLIHGALYVVAGSLWIPMLLHVLIDLSVGRVSLALHPEGDPGPDPWGGRRADIAPR